MNRRFLSATILIVLLTAAAGAYQRSERAFDEEVFDPFKINNVEFVKGYLDKGLDPNVRSNHPNNQDWLITYAVRRHALKTVELLLDRGAKVDARSVALDKTPLFQAAFQGDVAIATLLVKRGADVNAQDRYGENALREAIAGGRESMVEFLLEAGAKPDHRNKKGVSMRELAEQHGTPAIKASFKKRS